MKRPFAAAVLVLMQAQTALGETPCAQLGFHEVCIEPGTRCTLRATDPDMLTQYDAADLPGDAPCQWVGGPEKALVVEACGGQIAAMASVAVDPAVLGMEPSEYDPYRAVDVLVLIDSDFTLRLGPPKAGPMLRTRAVQSRDAKYLQIMAYEEGFCPPE